MKYIDISYYKDFRKLLILIDQVLNSSITFIFTLLIMRNQSVVEIAQLGVNFAAMYSILTICRPIIGAKVLFVEGKFAGQERFLLAEFLKKFFFIIPFIVALIALSCFLVGSDFIMFSKMSILTIALVSWDSLRSIVLRTSNQFSLFLSLLLATGIVLFITMCSPHNIDSFTYWSLIYYLAIVFYLLAKVLSPQNEMSDLPKTNDPNFQFRLLVLMDSVLNHISIYAWTLFIFHLSPLIAAEMRLTQTWIINIAATAYITASNILSIDLLEKQSSLILERQLNIFALLILGIACCVYILVSRLIILPFPQLRLEIILATCLIYYSFFVISRLTLHLLHTYKSIHFMLCKYSLLYLLLLASSSVFYFFDSSLLIICTLFLALFISLVFDHFAKKSKLIMS